MVFTWQQTSATFSRALLTLYVSFDEVQKLIFLRCMKCQHGQVIRKVSVRLSVCPSVKRMDCDKTEERSVQIFVTCERSFT